MRTFKVQGVIIQKREIGEKDYGITIFTPEFGKLFAYARGARNIKSKFQGHLDLLNICNFHIYQSTKNHIITDCCLVKNFNKFCCYLSKFYAVEEITKMIRTYTTENEESEDIYSLLTETLTSLENSKKENLILEAFKIKLFLLLGMMPDLNRNDFEPITIRMKKLMKYIIQNPYGEIQRINLCKNDARELERMTMLLSEQI